MKIARLLTATLMLLAIPAVSHARIYTINIDADFYAGGGYTIAEYKEPAVESADLKAFYLQGGVDLFDWVALEARAGYGAGEGEVMFNAEKYGIKLNDFYGFYTIVGWPNSSPVYPYLIGGYTSMDTEVVTPTSGTNSGSETGISWGFGGNLKLSGLNFLGFNLFELNLPENILLNAEYMQYLDNDTVTIGAVNMGVKYVF